MEQALKERSNEACELCGSTENLTVFAVTPKQGNTLDEVIYACKTCVSQINEPESADPNHWRCLNDAMWSEVSAVKVVAYRMLNNLKSEGWPNDLLDMMYLEEADLEWAKDGLTDEENSVVHRDSNGVPLEAGDSVVIIKDLNVKGSSIVAKRGTAVRNIRLVQDNPEHIEGKVDGQQIVILTKYVKK
ncbi:MAG: PhnA domain-containing protein [bacterium]|nr:PhnA domain-containing protein [bacterium]